LYHSGFVAGIQLFPKFVIDQVKKDALFRIAHFSQGALPE
jgi:hypothetical protein